MRGRLRRVEVELDVGELTPLDRLFPHPRPLRRGTIHEIDAERLSVRPFLARLERHLERRGHRRRPEPPLTRLWRRRPILAGFLECSLHRLDLFPTRQDPVATHPDLRPAFARVLGRRGLAHCSLLLT